MVGERLRIIVIEDDPAVATLLERVLRSAGHDVRTFSDPTICPVYRDHGAQCPRDKPCADVIFSDQMMPNITGLDFFLLQRERGCKALDENKAIVTAAEITPEFKTTAEGLGCQIFKKPFRVAEILQWVDECAERVR